MFNRSKNGEKIRRSLLDRLVTAFHFFGYWTVKIEVVLLFSMSTSAQSLKFFYLVKLRFQIFGQYQTIK